MGKLEKEFETLLTHFPNFISKELREMPEGDWGDINVCIRQGQLPECRGRIDIAFVTDTAVYLVELKRRRHHRASAWTITAILRAGQAAVPSSSSLRLCGWESVSGSRVTRKENGNRSDQDPYFSPRHSVVDASGSV